MNEFKYVWIFHGEGSKFCSAIFNSQEDALRWIKHNFLSGTLTKYPVGLPLYEWAIEKKYFSPKKPHEFSPEFKQTFSTAAQEHYHFSNGAQE